jgi:hypothetical protein
MAKKNSDRKILICIPESESHTFDLLCKKHNRSYKNMAETIIIEHLNSKMTQDGKKDESKAK